MKSESIVFAVAGAFFGLIVGWVIGSQQGSGRLPPAVAQAQGAPAARAADEGTSTGKAPFDERQAQALRSVVEHDPNNATARAQLGNLYFDAERYDEAIKSYEAALKINPRDVDVSTDLGVSYYYTNDPDRALKQFDYSLRLDPKHAKTLLNVGIVKAFGKQDLEGAAAAWQRVMQMAPDSAEAQAARRALDSMKSAHPGVGTAGPGQP